jgi:hypothetical protein
MAQGEQQYTITTADVLDIKGCFIKLFIGYPWVVASLLDAQVDSVQLMCNQHSTVQLTFVHAAESAISTTCVHCCIITQLDCIILRRTILHTHMLLPMLLSLSAGAPHQTRQPAACVPDNTWSPTPGCHLLPTTTTLLLSGHPTGAHSCSSSCSSGMPAVRSCWQNR